MGLWKEIKRPFKQAAKAISRAAEAYVGAIERVFEVTWDVYESLGKWVIDPGKLFRGLIPDIPELRGSSTYGSNGGRVGNTISEGVFVARCYGKCKIGCNKIRFNAADDADIRIIMAHCMGEVEGIVMWYVHDIEWSELTGEHTKTEYTGTRIQTADGRFTDKASPYRSIAYTAATFKKNDQQIGYDPHVTVVMEGLKVSGSWKKGAAAFGGIGRSGAVIAESGGKLYGGTGINGSYYKDWWKYDPATDVWTQKTNYPGAGATGVTEAVAVTIGDKIYVGTGCGVGDVLYKDWWEYNPANDTWTQKTAFGGLADEQCFASEAGGKAYVGLGDAADWWEYDPVGNSWTQKTDFPDGKRQQSSGALYNDKIYVGTGIAASGYKQDWWEYNPATNSWTQKADLPGVKRYCAVSALSNREIYLSSGYAIPSQGGYLNDCWKYDPEADSWKEVVAFRGSVFMCGVAISIDGVIYIGTGIPLTDQWYSWNPLGFTRNNALILQDWYLNVENYSPSVLNAETFISLEAFCDEVPSGSTLPRYRLDFNFDVNMTINDAKKLMFQAFNGQVIMSQGKLKPVWDSNQMANGSGGLTAKTVSHAFTENNIVKDSLTWHQPERPNTVRIHYIDSDKKYQKTSCEIKDEYDISINGEILYEESCWWITEGEIARRRCQFKYNKFLYTDYIANLSSFSGAGDLEIYDLVKVTHTLPGWTEKLFLVTRKGEDAYGIMQFTLEAYYEGVYSDAQVAVQAGYGSDLYNPFEITGDPTYVKSYDDADVSGTPIILEFQIQAGGTSYYIKVYPTISATLNETSDDFGIDVKTLVDADVSGSPEIFEFISGSIFYYAKVYLTVSAKVVNSAGVRPTPIMRIDADLSGTSRVAVFNVKGIEYYFKIYPTRA